MFSFRTIALTAAFFANGVAHANEAHERTPQESDVVVEGTRPALKQQVQTFVSALVHRAWGDESLVRWRTPICPLVAGIAREQGEAVLLTISQVARNAGAPLAASDCKRPNFLVIVTADPADLLQRWLKRDPRLLNGKGTAAMRRFENMPGPVLPLYNASVVCAATGRAASPGSRIGAVETSSCVNEDSRLKWNSLNVLDSVIVMVDARAVRNVRLGHLADYIATVGLVELDLDRSVGDDIPTVLHLFSRDNTAAQGISSFDRAFLKAAYDTTQRSKLQRWLIVDQMVEQLDR